MTKEIGFYSPGQPGLGWLIQNEQVNNEDLCAVLLEHYLPELACLAFILTGSPVAMLDAANQALALAIANRRQYTGDVPARNWLWNLVVTECLRFYAVKSQAQPGGVSAFLVAFRSGESLEGHAGQLYHVLGKRNSLLMVLAYGCELSEQDLAYQLGLSPDQVRGELQVLKARLVEHHESCAQCRDLPGGISDIAQMLYSALLSDQPVIKYSSASLARWKASILDQVNRLEKKRTARRLGLQVGQVSGLVVILLLSIGWVVARPRQSLPPLAVNSPFVSATRQKTPRSPVSTPTPTQTPVYTASPIPAPDVNIADIQHLVITNTNRWISLWADVEVIAYDPTGSASSKEKLTRKQVWISQPASARILSGPVDGPPLMTISIRNNHLHSLNFQNGQIVENLTSGLAEDTDLQKLFAPQNILAPLGVYKLVGSDRIALHAVWMIDHYEGNTLTDTIGVDQRYGIVLYRREYGGKDRKTVLLDAIVNSIVMDPSLSPSIFEPGLYQGNHFALDFSGTPEITNAQPALTLWKAPVQADLLSQPNLKLINPATSHLAFLNSVDPNNRTVPSLFEDGYFLGQLPLGGTAIMSCERSPDSSKIAYNSEGQGAAGDTALYVATLSAASKAVRVMPDGFTTGDFAFAPDSQKLAFFGCDQANGACGVFITNTATGEKRELVPLSSYADYIFWKPDGRYLAFVGSQDGQAILEQKRSANLLISEVMALSQPWYFYVVDASNGDIVYQQPFLWSLLSAPTDSPTNLWPTSFKTHLGGVSGCINPPQAP